MGLVRSVAAVWFDSAEPDPAVLGVVAGEHVACEPVEVARCRVGPPVIAHVRHLRCGVCHGSAFTFSRWVGARSAEIARFRFWPHVRQFRVCVDDCCDVGVVMWSAGGSLQPDQVDGADHVQGDLCVCRLDDSAGDIAVGDSTVVWPVSCQQDIDPAYLCFPSGVHAS